MVKIRIKHLLLGMLIFVLLMNVAYAAGSNLLFSNVDVKIGSKTLRNLSDGTTISEETRPGKTVEFRAEVRNNFTNLEDVTIKDITIKVTIEGIDNGNDLEQESDTFDLRADTERKITFRFEIPLEVEQDFYNVLIEAEGQDEDNTIQRAETKLKIEVAKDNHLLKIIQKELAPDPVSCRRNNIQLSTTILNIGKDDEDSVSIRISNSDLGINIDEKLGEIKARPNEPESMLSKIYTFKISDKAEEGSYPINIRVLYDLGRKVTEETATLNVNDCKKAVTAPAGKPAEGEGEGVELILPSLGKAISTVVQPPAGIVLTQEGFLSSDAFVVGIIMAEIAIVVIGVVLVVGLFRKKR